MEQQNSGTQNLRRDVTAQGFLEAMSHLRDVFFQDCALLQDKFPNLIVFQHQVFTTEKWRMFKLRVLEAQRVFDSEVSTLEVSRTLPFHV